MVHAVLLEAKNMTTEGVAVLLKQLYMLLLLITIAVFRYEALPAEYSVFV